MKLTKKMKQSSQIDFDCTRAQNVEIRASHYCHSVNLSLLTMRLEHYLCELA